MRAIVLAKIYNQLALIHSKSDVMLTNIEGHLGFVGVLLTFENLKEGKLLKKRSFKNMSGENSLFTEKKFIS